MECLVKKNEHFLNIHFLAFIKAVRLQKAAHDICVVYEESTIAERTAHDWHVKSKIEIFSQRSIWPSS